MRVAIVSCVYPPEPVVSSRTSADIAAALREDVTVICPFPSRPGGMVFPGYRRRWRMRESAEGIEIVRCFSSVSAESTLWSRFAENLLFGISSALALLPTRADVMFLNSWPVFATAFAAIVARLKRVPYIVSVQDVYPESLLSQRRTAARILAPLLRWIDERVARNAAAVIVLSETFASIYRDDRRVDPSRVHVIPNWYRDDSQASPEAAREIRRRFAIADDHFLVVYGGNVGAAAGVEQLIAAVARTERPDVRLLVAGGGAHLEACRELAARLAPAQVQFLSPWREDETAGVLAAADLLALPTAAEQSRYSVPSKLISYLLAERPVLVVAEEDSELARIVRESAAGWLTPPADEHELAAAILRAVATSEAARREMGVRGRRYAQTHFSPERCVTRILEIIRSSAS